MAASRKPHDPAEPRQLPDDREPTGGSSSTRRAASQGDLLGASLDPDDAAHADRPAAGRAEGQRGAPLPVAAAVAALGAAVLGLAPVAVLAAVGGLGAGSTVVGALRIAAGTWLLGQGVPITTLADRITLVPLTVTVWIAWRLARAGVHASRATGAHRGASPWPAVRAGLMVSIAYACIGALVCLLARTADVSASPWRAAATCGAFAAVMAVGGALRHGRAGRRLMRRVPRLVVQAVRAGIAATAFLVAAGAGAAGLALALHGRGATDLMAAFGAGVVGQVGITALCLAFLPNMAVWGAAYLVGPGFAVGAGTVVSPGDVLIGPVPALPVLAGLPSAPLTGVGPALLGVPFVAGLAAGILLAGAPSRSMPERRQTWLPMLGAAALAGPVAGVLVSLAMVASRGGLGSGRLADIGASDLRVAFFAGGVITVGTVLGAASRTVLRRA
jgi:hypothetical protein